MNYIGEKSLSSLLGHLLFWFWFIMLILMIIGIPPYIIALFNLFPNDKWIGSWIDFMTIERPDEGQTIAIKILYCIQTAVIAPVVLIMIKKFEKLLRNFTDNHVFYQNNVKLLSDSTILVIVLAVADLDIIAMLSGIILLLLTAIFRHGVMLQEENDLTV